jgi:hypothetical protein
VAVTGSLERPMLYLFLAMGIFYLIQPTLILVSRSKAKRSDVMWAAVFFIAGGLLLVKTSSFYRSILPWCSIVIPFAFVEVLFVHWKKRQTLTAQIFGVLGLSAIAPLSYMLFKREATWEAALLWIVAVGFFSCGILFARFQIARLNAKSSSDFNLRRERRWLLIYHLTLVIILFWIAARSLVNVSTVFIFAPAVTVSLLAGMGCFPSTTIRQTGWLIVAQTILFVILLAITH